MSAVLSRLEPSRAAPRFAPSGIELVLELSCRGLDILELLQRSALPPHRPSFGR
jgi:hypothetical protein